MKKIEKAKEERYQAEIICIDELVPKNHLLRKIDSAIDFGKIYEFVEVFTAKTTEDRVLTLLCFLKW